MKKNWILFFVFLLLIYPLQTRAEASSTKPFTVCIDPGHQAKGDHKRESASPLTGQTKARVSSGTVGVSTKKPEYKVNLEAALLLKELLTQKDYHVVMTRTTHDVNISNKERAELANQAKADMTIRIHCDSIANRQKTGATLLVPSKESKETKGIYEKSNAYAVLLQKALQEAGVKVNGVFERKDITGFNWSKVPVVILEMGFMSNPGEDQMLSNKAYQTKLMEAVAKALEMYQKTSSAQ
jgi:N-acetylmuramoyl-L-alanine amidase